MVQIPLITNWSVFPQNGDLEYFDDMNVWIGQGNTVIPSANASIVKMNEAIVEINNIAENAINAITFNNIAQLRLNSNIGRVDVLGYYTKGDGGGGTFCWDPTSTESDNGGTIIKATGISTGRWKRVFSGAVNIKWFGAKCDGVTDNTTIVQYVIDNFKDIYFEGTVAVTSITLENTGSTYTNMNVKGIATSPTEAVVIIKKGYLNFNILIINQNFNENYTAALKWISPYQATTGESSQHISIDKLALLNSKIGILYGEIGVVENAIQSENYIKSIYTRGVEKVCYSNILNGVLFISGGVLDCTSYEWLSVNPSNFSTLNSTIIECFNGTVFISNCELLKPQTNDGYGIVVKGGRVFMDNVNIEIASQPISVANNSPLSSSSDLTISNSFGYWSNNTGVPYILVTDDSAKVTLDNVNVHRPSAHNQSYTGFIKVGNNSNADITITNCNAYEFLPNSVFQGDATGIWAGISKNTRINNFKCKTSSVISGQNSFILRDNSRDNFLDSIQIDYSCSTLFGWNFYNYYGGGTIFELVTDAPTVAQSGLVQSKSIRLLATGEASISSLNTTSESTVKESGLKVSNGDFVLVSGWYKSISAGANKAIEILGIKSDFVTKINIKALSGNEITSGSGWRYFEIPVKISEDVSYIGVGIYNYLSESYFCNMKIKKI